MSAYPEHSKECPGCGGSGIQSQPGINGTWNTVCQVPQAGIVPADDSDALTELPFTD